MKKAFLLLSFLMVARLSVEARNPLKMWSVASESKEYTFRTLHTSPDTFEIVAPKGITLWYNTRMKAPVTIEYDACLMLEEGHPEDRLSDLNCFWMADQKLPSGRFVDTYAMQLYYMGYGGNHNSTTRFRRYNGDRRGIDSAQYRPAILKEYTDEAHLNKANLWRHIRLTADASGRVTYEIDGEKLVDYLDPEPLTSGYFGIRTTWSRLRFTNFTYREETASQNTIQLNAVIQPDLATAEPQPVRFGVPFACATVKSDDSFLLNESPIGFRPLAFWPDGSVRWGSFYGTTAEAETYTLQPISHKAKNSRPARPAVNSQPLLYLPQSGSSHFCDSIVYQGRTLALRGTCTLDGHPLAFRQIGIERQDAFETIYKAVGDEVMMRIYTTSGSPEIRIVHTYLNHRDEVKSLAIELEVPMREALYNRHVAFALDNSCWHEPVQPLTGRRALPDNLYHRQMQGETIAPIDSFDARQQALIHDWASWSNYRLSQLSDNGFTLRKRAKSQTPWIGTRGGHHAAGTVFVGDTHGGWIATLHDFWQSYPSSLSALEMTSDCALLRIALWPEEAETMDLRHYDTEAHGLEAAYEDVQEGMSTPFGIARTSTLSLRPTSGWMGDEAFLAISRQHNQPLQLLPTPEYLHRERAFGIWSLPTNNSNIEEQISYWSHFMLDEQQRRQWYGYWNYGDVMHAFDPEREEWRYDIGGFAWDNTELASNMMLWYSFLRSGDPDLWQAAVAMTRHTSEVDVYHFGPYAGLGSRHNVTHWGCGAKESRISQAAWNRFYYYLSGGDERTGDLMRDVVMSDTLLYTLDPMRLAQPRELYPCTAPARLRIGPDWLGYAGNWMTEYERTLDVQWLRKIITGMQSINRMPGGIFSGPKALGYDPATGVISNECDSSLRNTNHLLSIMGGFEVLNEMLALPVDQIKSLSPAEREAFNSFRQTWLDHCRDYRQMADSISQNGFLIPRLQGYAAWHDRDPQRAKKAWDELRRIQQTSTRFSTNGISCYILDAIYLLETLR